MGGRFVTNAMKVRRSTWFVARCGGVFTPVLKVTGS
jgi:hypothetical protein